MSILQRWGAVLTEPVAHSRFGGKARYVHCFPTCTALLMFGLTYHVRANRTWVGSGELLEEVDFYSFLSYFAFLHLRKHAFYVIQVALFYFFQAFQLYVLIGLAIPCCGAP